LVNRLLVNIDSDDLKAEVGHTRGVDGSQVARSDDGKSREGS